MVAPGLLVALEARVAVTSSATSKVAFPARAVAPVAVVAEATT